MRFSPGIPRGALPGGLGVLFEGLERFAGRLGTFCLVEWLGALPGGLNALLSGLERFAGRLGARVKAGGIII